MINSNSKKDKPIYTEIRIVHTTIEDKEEYENKLDSTLKKSGYKTRTEWIREQIRNLTRDQ